MGVWTNYISAAILYNLQILPDVLLCGIIILGILLANQSVLVLGAVAIGSQLLTSTVGRLMLKYAPDGAVLRSSLDMCTGGYIGKSWERLLGMDANDMWSPRAPSLYMSALAFFVGWGGALQQLYKEEIDAGIVSRSTVTACIVIMGITLLAAIVARYAAGCETIMNMVGGLVMGGVIGYFLAIALGFATDRRATNIWGIPLLRDRINSGAAVYVCPK